MGDDDVFELQVVTTDGVQVVALRGELDVANSDRVHRALLEAEGPTVVVDLSTLRFIDSSGLTALIHAYNALTGRGQVFELRGASGSVQRVFEITGLSTFLTRN
jgi:anti-sigma B factor antagonist